jgi:hypothetical protein
VTDAQGKAGFIALGIITALAFFTRFYKLDHPNEVVFDEVHFGKFASYVFFLIVPENKAPASRTGKTAKLAKTSATCALLLFLRVLFVFASQVVKSNHIDAVVPATIVFFRCPSSDGEDALCLYGLVDRI